MFQIIFNELSAAEISALPKRLQLELLAEFQILPEDLEHFNSERFGVIERAGKNCIATARKTTGFISPRPTRELRSTAYYTRTRFAIFFFGANCLFRRMRNSVRRASSGSLSSRARRRGRCNPLNVHKESSFGFRGGLFSCCPGRWVLAWVQDHDSMSGVVMLGLSLPTTVVYFLGLLAIGRWQKLTLSLVSMAPNGFLSALFPTFCGYFPVYVMRLKFAAPLIV